MELILCSAAKKVKVLADRLTDGRELHEVFIPSGSPEGLKTQIKVYELQIPKNKHRVAASPLSEVRSCWLTNSSSCIGAGTQGQAVSR